MPTAVISTTYDDKYLWYLPLTTWVWNKLGVDVVCFMPNKLEKTTYPNKISFGDSEPVYMLNDPKICLIINTCYSQKLRLDKRFFTCPEHKEATYAQCSRLYGACLDLPEDEVLISSDADMLVFSDFVCQVHGDKITSYGFDLTPEGQLPICYATATVNTWRRVMNLDYGTTSFEDGGVLMYKVKTYQECLDNLLGDIDCENMRGNYWAKDQEELASKVFRTKDWFLVQRAKPGTQFADKRYDRDDAYILDRLSPDTIDYHTNRPGYEDRNFAIILQVLKYHFPDEDFGWLIDYNEAYKQLL